MISFDLEKGKESQLLDTGGSCAVLKYHGRYVGCGDTSGKIHLRDPHNLNICHTLDTHRFGQIRSQHIESLDQLGVSIRSDDKYYLSYIAVEHCLILI